MTKEDLIASINEANIIFIVIQTWLSIRIVLGKHKNKQLGINKERR